MLPLDLELKLLSKDPIMVNDIPVYPIALSQIIEYGYLNYLHAIRMFSMSRDELLGMLNSDIFNGIEEITDDMYFNLIVVMIEQDVQLKSMFLDILSLTCRCEIQLSLEPMGFLANGKTIDANTFVEMQEIVRLRNRLETKSESEDNPADERTRLLLEKKKKLQRKLKRNSEDYDDSPSLADYISIFSYACHKPISDIMEYDLYQFFNQFNRLMMIKEYDTNILALLHGASSEKIELTHWISKIPNT